MLYCPVTVVFLGRASSTDIRRFAMTVAMSSGGTDIGTALPRSTTVTEQYDIA